MFIDESEIDIEDESDNDPSQEKLKEDEQLPKKDEAQLEFHCEQCNYETMSNAYISHHVKLKHKSFNNFLKSKGLPILFYFHNRNPKNMKRKPLNNTNLEILGKNQLRKQV